MQVSLVLHNGLPAVAKVVREWEREFRTLQEQHELLLGTVEALKTMKGIPPPLPATSKRPPARTLARKRALGVRLHFIWQVISRDDRWSPADLQASTPPSFCWSRSYGMGKKSSPPSSSPCEAPSTGPSPIRTHARTHARSHWT